jgi:hypothetical protein
MLMNTPITRAHVKLDIPDDTCFGRGCAEYGIAHIWPRRTARPTRKYHLIGITITQRQDAASRQGPPTPYNILLINITLA